MTPHEPAEDLQGQADPLAEAIRIAELVQSDQRQRAVPYGFTSKREADDFRSVLRDELVRRADGGDLRADHVRPWVWTTDSSGSALTEEGRASGVEVRLSYYQASLI